MGLERWREMQVTVPLLPSHTLLRFAWPNYPSVIWHNDLSPSLHREWGCMRKSECDTMREREGESVMREGEGERCKWNLKSVSAPRFLPFIYCITPFMPHEAPGERICSLVFDIHRHDISNITVISMPRCCSWFLWAGMKALLFSFFVFCSSRLSTSSVSPPAPAPLQQRTRIINHNQRWRLLKTGLSLHSQSPDSIAVWGSPNLLARLSDVILYKASNCLIHAWSHLSVE